MFKALYEGLKHEGGLKIWIMISVPMCESYTTNGMSCGHDIMGRSNKHFVHANLERGFAFFLFHLCMEYILCSRLKIYLYQLLGLDEYCHKVHDIFHIFYPC